jgi:hypothetical protein
MQAPSAILHITKPHTCRHGAIGACLCPQTLLLALRDPRGVYLVVHGCWRDGCFVVDADI